MTDEEEFISIEKVCQIDDRHMLLAEFTGQSVTLEKYHEYLLNETLNDEVPKEVKSQFNVAKNMALYSYFLYSLAPEVQLKTYTVIEHALRLKVNSKNYMTLRKLVNHAVAQRWIKDKGFRHITNPSKDNAWCKELPKNISEMRNNRAHGQPMLTRQCLRHISICADFLNQIFPES